MPSLEAAQKLPQRISTRTHEADYDFMGNRVVDDLTELDGIGPVFQSLLAAALVTNMDRLAALSEKELKARILSASPEAKTKLNLAKMGKWIEQAQGRGLKH